MIAFDFKDALSFEGETGPYVQYAVVRVNGILRKGAELASGIRRRVDAANLARIESGEIDVARFLARARGRRSMGAGPAGGIARRARGCGGRRRRNRRFSRASPSSWRKRSTSSTTSITFSRKKTPKSARFCCGSRSWCANNSSRRSACLASPRRKENVMEDAASIASRLGAARTRSLVSREESCERRRHYIFSAKSTIERIATPVGPFASHGRPSSTQHVDAISR